MNSRHTDSGAATLTDHLKTLPLHGLPHHALSRLMQALTRVRWQPLKNRHIDWFIRHFEVDLTQAQEQNPHRYPTFNHFFTRALKPGARLVASGPGQIACPVDGRVSQAGAIDGDTLFQAKGHTFDLTDLLGGDAAHAALFRDGSFATLYLSPRDYHRIHMPLDGNLREMVHVPGRLFSVSPASTRTVPRVFARNERVVTLFDTPGGPMALIMVGALFVGSIETVWHGVVTPPRGRHIRRWQYPLAGRPLVHLRRGDELGRFNMGSTVIVLFGPDRVRLDAGICAEAPVRMGQLIALHGPA